MKIRKLSLKNINSIKGEWTIDFTSEDFSKSSLFAICGNTGAGKSTILDAICLALYGATPRQGKIAKNTFNVMNNDCDDCRATVEFSVKNRVTHKEEIYIASWEQKRTATGKLSMTIRNALTGDCPAEKDSVSDVKNKIKDIIGLDYEQFCKTVILAQGKFAEFLDAKSNDKADILAELTTRKAIYQTIGERTLKVQTDLEKEISDIDTFISGVAFLTEEEVKQKETELSNLTKLDEESNKEIKVVEEAKILLSKFKDSQDKLDSALKEKGNIDDLEKTCKDDFENAQKQLAEAEKKFDRVDELDKNLGILGKDKEHIEKQRKVKAKELTDSQIKIDDYTKIINELENSIKEAKTFIKANEKCEEMEKDLVEIKLLFNSIKLNNDSIKKIDKSINGKDGLCKTIEQLKSKLSQSQKELESEKSTLDSLKHQIDEEQNKFLDFVNINGEIKELEEDKNNLSNRISDIEKCILYFEQIKNNNGRLFEIDNELSKLNKQHSDNLQQKEQKLQQLEQNEKDLDEVNRKLEYLKVVDELAFHRTNLKPGEECPLCGAKNHPYIENLEKFKNVNSELNKEYQVKLKDLNENINKINKVIRELTTHINVFESVQKTFDAEKTKLDKENKKHIDNVSSLNYYQIDVKLLDIKTIDDGYLSNIKNEQVKFEEKSKGLDLLINEYKKQKDNVDKLKDKVVEAESKYDKNLNNLKVEQSNIDNKTQLLDEKKKELAGNQSLFDNELKKLVQLINAYLQVVITVDMDIDAISGNINDLSNKLDLYNENKKIYQENQPKLETAEKVLKELNEVNPSLKAELEKLENESKEVCDKYDKTLCDRKELLGDKKVSEERSKFSQIVDEMREKFSFAKNNKELNDNKIAEERDKLTKFNLDLDKLKESFADNVIPNLSELDKRKTELERIIKETFQKIGALNKELETNVQNSAKVAKKLERQTKLKAIKETWASLYEKCMKNKDCDTFKKYVLSIIFKQMVIKANNILRQLSNRYALNCKDDGELDLDLIDYEQDDDKQTRVVSNLSGGEKFIVSLSLALGLSDLLNENYVSIDSLFIDEGFGTLDEETLNKSIDVLNNLGTVAGSKKLIGIISHVGNIKENMVARIEASAGTRGSSVLSGSGVTHADLILRK